MTKNLATELSTHKLACELSLKINTSDVVLIGICVRAEPYAGAMIVPG